MYWRKWKEISSLCGQVRKKEKLERLLACKQTNKQTQGTF
jgi:hypothetical protein